MLLSFLGSSEASGVVGVSSIQQLRLALKSSNAILVQNDLTFNAKEWPESELITIAAGRHVVLSGAGATRALWPLIDFNYIHALITLEPNSTLEFRLLYLHRFHVAGASAFPGEWVEAWSVHAGACVRCSWLGGAFPYE
jgi:hypothetical protein